MSSGFYTSAVGMLDGYNVENNISDNLSNMQTPGYKQRSAVVGDFTQALYNTQRTYTDLASGQIGVGEATAQIGSLGSAPQIDHYGVDLTQGSPKYTGQPLDLMIVGNAYLAVKNGNQTLLTRNGALHRTALGVLETADGYQVLDTKGKPITIPSGASFQIDQAGNVRAQGRVVAQVGLRQVAAGRPLTGVGSGYFAGPGTTLAPNTPNVGILQGYLETSNVDLSTQMSSMLSAQRAYQEDSEMMQIQDGTTSLAVNDLGKVG